MNRLDAMLQRLPPLYNRAPGSLIHQALSLFANSMAEVDEEMNRVQRSHWIDSAFDRDDLAKLGALFEIPIAAWEPNHLYRARLKATIAARLRGAVSRDVLELVLLRIIDGAQNALGMRFMQIPATIGSGRVTFHTGPSSAVREPAFIEFPIQRKRSQELGASQGLMRSLGQFTIHNRGLHPVPLLGAIRGVAGRITTVPVLVNLTNGHVFAYAGDLACGRELHLGIDEEGMLTAHVGELDVRDRVYTGKDFEPGADFTPVLPDPQPQPLMLERGQNLIWYFPLALFDERILDAGVLGMPEAHIRHGRYTAVEREADGTLFDQSLFEQPPSVSLDLWWDEETVASFRVEIPAGVVRREAGRDGALDADRTRLFVLLQQTVNLLRAAAVDGRVLPRALGETQHLQDRMRVLDPTELSDELRMESRLSGLSALFDDSATEGSRFG